MTKKKFTIKGEKASKTPSLWPIKAYCTKFGYILGMAWSDAQDVTAEH